MIEIVTDLMEGLIVVLVAAVVLGAYVGIATLLMSSPLSLTLAVLGSVPRLRGNGEPRRLGTAARLLLVLPSVVMVPAWFVLAHSGEVSWAIFGFALAVHAVPAWIWLTVIGPSGREAV